MNQEITFVFLGSQLPRYAECSLSLARRWSGVDVVLVGNHEIQRNSRLSVSTFVPLEDFYDDSKFAIAREKVTLPHGFRSGFWLKTLERFFVLAQYMQVANRKHLLHAELDQLLFRMDVLTDRLLSLEDKGLFVPFHDESRGVASILFCNDIQWLNALTDFACATDPFPNEMMLLANYGRESSHIHALPTLQPTAGREFNTPPIQVNRIHRDHIGGVADALQLGMWITGMDPRNIPFYSTPRNHFVELDPSLLREDDLRPVKFHWDSDSGFLTANSESLHEERIYNIHAHSKIHPWLVKSEDNFTQLLKWANSDRSRILPGTKVPQMTSLVSKIRANVSQNPSRIVSEARKSVNLFLGRRPSSSPFISGDTFRSLANHVWESGQTALEPQDLSDDDVVFCQSDLIGSLNERVLRKSAKRITLLLGNSDQNHDAQVASALQIRDGVRIVAQNLLERVPRWSVLPIGLENAQLSQNGIPRWFVRSRSARSKQEKVFRVLSSFSIWTNPLVRNQALLSLRKSSVVDIVGQISAKQHHKALSRYAFVAAPLGNGTDTHRVWEAFYLDCIPIVLDSYVNRHYESIGLPVLVVRSFEELQNWKEEDLRSIYSAMRVKFESEYLWATKWWQLIIS